MPRNLTRSGQSAGTPHKIDRTAYSLAWTERTTLPDSSPSIPYRIKANRVRTRNVLDPVF